ncbi:MAG TPA: glycosyltransferase [Xanthomonadaceae bacterium]|nr:glycosyltransferase [Xanthomonadaceae bacterium]
MPTWTTEQAAALAGLTVVVPVGPGDALSPQLCTQLEALPPGSELRVVCADVADVNSMRTFAGTRWQCGIAPSGRAAQQNAGADAATRDWLWFLHADSRLAGDTLAALATFLQRGEAALGYFDLRFLDDGPWLTRLNAAGAWVRSRVLGLPFGDQGLLLPRALFTKLGGFDTAISRGEDHDLVWRARRAGVPIQPVRATLYTSARKYAECGWWPTTLAHQRETWRQVRRFARAGTAQ